MTDADRDAIAARLRAGGSVWAEDEADLLCAEFPDPDRLDRAIARRVSGEPLEVVLGWALFRGLRIGVAPGVFVPRPRTGFLVDVALELLAAMSPPAGRRPVVADVCCGTGVLGAAIRAARPGIELVAGDLDPDAVAVARRNLPDVPIAVGDLFDAIPQALRGRIDLVVANVPYVPTAELDHLPREAREHEPRRALDGGAGGLDVYRRLLEDALGWLAPGGSVVSEIAAHQVPAARRAVEGAGLQHWIRTSADGDTTVSGATGGPRRR